ncbi:hypothetical protein CJ483_19805 [Bacillus sp. PK3_68]|nr:hypothetical protein CJ483_19805 [Bacillus sp. PK3_68]
MFIKQCPLFSICSYVKKKEQGEKIGKEGNRYNISWMTAAETCKREAGRLEDQRTIKDSLF